MIKSNLSILDSPLGKTEIDHLGSPVGVVRMDATKSYSGIGKLLQQYINDSKQEAWEAIKEKINYTYGFPSLYALAFHYADLTQNQGRYSGRIRNRPDPDGISTYFSRVSSGQEKPLDFIVHIPPGYDKIAGSSALHVEVTTDPAKILTATFLDGKETWAGL